MLDAQRGFGAGFDFVRIALAMAILAFHSVVVTGALDSFMSTPLWIVPNSLVPMFFAVSGFLITGSALRLRLHDFLINRGLRIFPALAMDIAISAVILGPIFTTLPLSVYFLDKNFWEYFGSMAGLIQYDLPGVFLSNESAGVVNQSLWTVPYEFLCYIAMSLIIVLRLLHRPRLLLMLSTAFLLMPVLIQLTIPDLAQLPKVLSSLFFGRGSGSFQCFVAGILFYLFRDRVPFSMGLAAAAAFAVAILAIAGNSDWAGTGALNLALVPCLTYFILFVGLSPIPKIPIYSGGDYSYGVYLYGYPVQQAIYALISDNRLPWLNYAIAVPVVTIIAALSWHFVEKPILKLRKRFSVVGRRVAEQERRGDAPASAEPALQPADRLS